MNHLREARLLLGLTQEQLAQSIDVSVRRLRAYEQGDAIPSTVLIRLAVLANVTTDYLLGLTERN